MGKSKKAATEIRKIRVSNFAYQNIDEIISFIAFENRQPVNALKISEAIENAIKKIGENPFAYKECLQLPTKAKIYRQAICLSWLIIYKISTAEVLILSVIHGARNPSKIRKLKKIK